MIASVLDIVWSKVFIPFNVQNHPYQWVHVNIISFVCQFVEGKQLFNLNDRFV